MKTIRPSQRQKTHRIQAASSGDLFDSELWCPDGQKGVLQRLTVIGPYPTDEFFSQFLNIYEPRKILLVADEGCSREVIDRICKLCETRIRIRYASCRNCGLLHAKVYFAEWDTGIARNNRLLWGSMNASRNGFQVNGEVVSAVTLDADQDRAILPYFRRLWEQESGFVRSLSKALLGGVKFLLPEFRFFPPTLGEPETFDAWVQAGRLCHKFQRDQTFAKLSVKLRKPLPKGMLENIFRAEGLRADTKTDTIRFSYLRDIVPDDNETKPRWLSSYFLETWLGHWTSSFCYRARERKFTATNQDQREADLTRIKKGSERNRRKWCDDFLERLHRVLKKIEESGHRPQAYFDMTQDELNVEQYRKKALKELEYHRKRARNSIFADRFTKGFEFPPLPPFRGAEAVEGGSFEDFLESLCESILNGLLKRKPPRIVRRFRDKLTKYESEWHVWTGKQLLDVLRQDWHKIGTYIRGFYVERQSKSTLFD